MKRVVHFVLLCAGLATPCPALAGSAWPRGQNHAFASVSWSSWGDLMGYYESLQETFVEAPQLKTTEELTFYAEYGLTDRLTAGLDSHRRPEDGSGANIWYLRANIGPSDWWSQYAVELGVGRGQDYLGESDTLWRVAGLYGRGFTGFGLDGWVNIDARVEALPGTEDMLYKVDSTFGIKPDDKRLLYLELQTGKIGDNPGFTRVVPTYVRKLGQHLSLEGALLYGIDNDESVGAKIGVWTEF